MDKPQTWVDGVAAGDVIQGSLGNCWFISAMSVLATRQDLLKNVIVSDRNKAKGIYTLKFSKAGMWRYVHIDDRIPCNPSGKAHYAKSKDPNETWVMLIEKAYAKLHGCYEILSSGCHLCFIIGFLHCFSEAFSDAVVLLASSHSSPAKQ